MENNEFKKLHIKNRKIRNPKWHNKTCDLNVKINTSEKKNYSWNCSLCICKNS